MVTTTFERLVLELANKSESRKNLFVYGLIPVDHSSHLFCALFGEREREKVKIRKSSFYTTVTKICLVGCKVLVSLRCQFLQSLGILIFLD